MPLVPNFIERLAFFTLNQGPGPMVDMWSQPAARAVTAGIRLGVFEALADGPVTADALAAKLGTDPLGTRILLDTLTSVRYLKQGGGRYGNRPMTRKWLLSSSPFNLAPFYLYWAVLMEHFFPRLEESIRTGSPPLNLYEWLEDQPEASRYFQEGMIGLARFAGPAITKTIPVTETTRRVLDIGGGHGTYAIQLCRAHPHLEAVIFDGAQALTTGREAVAEAGMADRISFHEGSFLSDDLPSGFDMALVLNIVHGFTPEANIDLLRKVAGTLNPGGRIIIGEQIQGSSPLPLANTVTNILSLAYFHLLGGQAYSYDDLRGWLGQAGFHDVQRKPVYQASSVLVSAVYGG